MSARDWFGWLGRFGWGKRRAERLAYPCLAAYYWDGDSPKAHSVRDISSTGLYVETQDRWYPRTLVRLTLQLNSSGGEADRDAVTVETRVMRVTEDGVGFAFVAGSGTGNRKVLDSFLKRVHAVSH